MRAPLHGCVAVLLLACCLPSARAAVPIDVINVDLSPLIDESARYPTRFAVDIARPVSASNQGRWSDDGHTSTWTYTTRIATAVSMSFHASELALPPSAVLNVTGAGSSGTYRARDVNRGGLWVRPLPGDTLSVSLSVDDAERSAVRLQIASFQAGYRSLGGAVPDNAHYRQKFSAAAAAGNCTENYSCNATAANQGPAHATVAILVGNTAQCTGTLLNDTASDGVPYVLTARHCETGVLGGGDPGAAASVTVYWDAVTLCGTTLASIYDGNAVTQSGATTVVEQQDAWLLRLDSAPAASDAYYAGWDATGGTFSGGYSVHHAMGYDKQYAGWYGQPLLQTIPGATLKIGYASTFWGVVNQVGSVGAGASGGALFNPDNRAVGSATLAQLVDGANSAGVCPAVPPVAPSASTLTAQYTALASVWNATSDTTSTTGSATLQSVLNAAKTAQLATGGVAILPVALSSSNGGSVFTGDLVTLSWSAPGASTCTASGGLSGDGWGGSQAASGTLQLTEQSGGNISYTLHCSAGGMAGTATIVISWVFVSGYAAVTGPVGNVAAGSTAQLQWASNTQPCIASGGTTGDGWAGAKATSGSQNLVVSVIGSITYTITCGTGARIGTGHFTINAVAPSVSAIVTDANNMRVGQPANLMWNNGGLCTASGGAAGDGWAGSVFTTIGGGQAVTETTAGTYTYTVTCVGAGLSASSSISLTFTNAPPAVSLTASPTPVEIYTDPGAYGTAIVNLNFTTNVRSCAITYTGPGNVHGQITYLQGVLPNGSAEDSEAVAGAYVYTVTCGTGSNQQQSSAVVTWFTKQPSVTLTAPNPWPLGFGSTLSWNSNVYPCTGAGGATGDGWAGSKAGPSGNQTVTESTPGSLTFGITCGSGAQIVQAQATTAIIARTVSITASASTVAINQGVTISWTANFAPCTSSISPGSAGGWGTVLPTSGQYPANEDIPGTYTYTINCAGAQASTQVTFTGPTPAASLSASASSVTVNTPITLTWTSPDSSSCTASGGVPGDGWSGPVQYAGFKDVTSLVEETVTYSIACTEVQGQLQAQTHVTYTAVAATEPSIPPPPAVTLTASGTTEAVGSQVTLSWNSQNASACSASGGAADDGWSGNLALSGNIAVSESTAGSFTYIITCAGVPPAATARAKVEFTDITVTGNTGLSNGGGGGGALDMLCLVPLCLLALRSCCNGHSNR
jgi:hypothetical protein